MLDINLLSLPVVLFLCAIVTGSLVFLSAQFDRDWHWKRLPLLAAASLVLVIAGKLAIVHVTNSPDELPPHFMLIEAPLAVSVCLAVMVMIDKIIDRRKKEVVTTVIPSPFSSPISSDSPYTKASYLVTIVLIVSSMLFGLSLVNRYYRYYPTLGSVFGKVSVSALGKLPRRSTKPNKIGQARPPLATIQGSLESLHHATTGRVFSVDIPGKVSGFNARSAWIYEPPIALNNTNVALPVLVLLPGEPGTTSDWLNAAGAADTANAFAATHDGITPLIVMVDDNGSVLNDTECVDSQWGNVETYLTKDVPNFVKHNFLVSDNASQWAIGGLSMGGTCSIMLALDHPDTYHYFLDFSGELGPEIGTKDYTVANLFHNSESAWADHQPSLLLKKHDAKVRYKGMGGFFADGNGDTAIVSDANNELYTLAKNDDLDVVSESPDGQHTFALWKQAFSDALPWLSNRLGATTCQNSCHSENSVFSEQ